MEDWVRHPTRYAYAATDIQDHDGIVKRGERGVIADYDSANGYVIVEFAQTGPTLCDPDEVSPMKVGN